MGKSNEQTAESDKLSRFVYSELRIQMTGAIQCVSVCLDSTVRHGLD